MHIRGNERSEVIELISEINLTVEKLDIQIKKAGGENTLRMGAGALFPDIILFGDTARTHVLQGWEAKMPDMPITDSTLISNATIKANILGVNSFILWNFSAARLYVKNQQGSFNIIKGWNLPHICNREDVKTYQTEWKKQLKNILFELNEYFVTGKFQTASLETTLTDGIGVALIQRNKETVASTLRNKSFSDTQIAAVIKGWWIQVHKEYFKDEKDPFSAYSKTLILHWFNRIVFAHLIKKFFNPAREVELIDNKTTITQASAIFRRITESCDFYNIFNARKYEEFLSDNAWSDLVALNDFLKENTVADLTQESLQNILEKAVNSGKRELSGQYATPQVLADILVRITLRNLRGNFFDPCCGTGTIAKAAKDYKKEQLQIAEAINTVWAEDRDAFATQIAQLAVSDVLGINIPTRIFKANIFDLRSGEAKSFVDPSNGTTIELNLPQFEGIASNLPFVAFENIKDDEKESIERVFSEVAANTEGLDGRSDIYIPMIFSLWKHLKNDSYLGIITSNSWLANKAGKRFYNAATHYYNVEQIHMSGNGKWFNNADIVTTIILLKKKTQIAPPNRDEKILFYLWKKKLSDLEVADNQQKLIFSALQGVSVDENVVSVREYSLSEITHLEGINLNKAALFHDVKWVLELQNSLCPITNKFNVVRGIKSCWDDFFYPSNAHIEPEFLKPILLSPQSVDTLSAKADKEAFCCDMTPQMLMERGYSGAVDWINRFSCEQLPVSLRQSRCWYNLPRVNNIDFVTALNSDARLFFAEVSDPTLLINQRLTCLRLNPMVNKDLCHALLNTMLSMFFIECVGFGRGQGVLDTSKTNMENLYMLNPDLITPQNAEKIITAFKPLRQRKVKKTEEELQMADRIAFDQCVLRVFGLEDYYDKIKNSLISLQRTRLSVKK